MRGWEVGSWGSVCAGGSRPPHLGTEHFCPTERGDFLALDLGGTNFRVLLVRVAASGVQITSEIYSIPEHVAQGSGEQVPAAWG